MGGGAFFEDLSAAPSAWPPVLPQAGLARGSPFAPAAVDLLRRQLAAARPEKLAGERKLAGGQARATRKDKAVAAHDADVPHKAAYGLGARRPAETERPVVVPVYWPSSKSSGEASTSSAQRSERSTVPEVVTESKPQVVPVPVKKGKGEAGGPSTPTRLRMELPAAATKIQAAFRGHAVRASRPLQQLRKLVSLAGSLKDLQASWETEDKELLRTDAKVGRRWAELVMSHLLQLDSIQTTNASVRQRRRELVKSAVAFQEAIDAAVSSKPSEAASVETPATELNVELTSGLESNSPAEDLVTESASNASIAHGVEPSHQEPVITCKSQVPEVPEGADSVSSDEGNTVPEAEASKTVTGIPSELPASSHQKLESQFLESEGLPSTSIEQKAEDLSNSDTVVAQPVEAAAELSSPAAEAEQSTDAVATKLEGLCGSGQEETADMTADLADNSGPQQQAPQEQEEPKQLLPPPPSEQPAQQPLQQLPQQQPSEQVAEILQQDTSLQPVLQPVLDSHQQQQQQQQQQDEISKEDSKALAIKYLVQKVQQQEKDKAMLKLTADLYQAALSRSLSDVKALKVALAQQCGGQVPHVSDLKTGHCAGHSHLQLPSNPHQALSSNLSR